jgi:hypothetical protein
MVEAMVEEDSTRPRSADRVATSTQREFIVVAFGKSHRASIPLGNPIETVYSQEQNENASQARLALL